MPKKEIYQRNRQKFIDDARAWKLKNPERNKENNRISAKRCYDRDPEKFLQRGREWQQANPEKRRQMLRDWHAKNPDYNREYLMKRAKADPRKYMWQQAKGRAARQGIPFTITLGDIVVPEFCPILGVKMELGNGSRGASPSAPSLDKVIPELGYIPGNIRVISYRANMIKGRSRPWELLATYQYAERETQRVLEEMGLAMQPEEWQALVNSLAKVSDF